MYDNAQEKNMKAIIFRILIIKLKFRLPKTKLAPNKEERSAWLSLEGMPKSQATNPKITTAEKQEIQIAFPSALFEKSANENTLFVTLALRREKTTTPSKLKTADIKAPCQSLAVFDATSENIAFGASVQPFIKTTIIERKNAKKPSGVSIFDQKM